MKKIIISMLLSMFFIHLHAQTGLPYKSLSDFRNDTTAFINYNFIDRAELYQGKTLEFMLHDLQIPVKSVMVYDSPFGKVYGLFLYFYSYEEKYRLSNSTINKPYGIQVTWKPVASIGDWKISIYLREDDKIINNCKNFHITQVDVIYPLESEHEQSKPKLRSSEVPDYDGIIYEN